MASESEPKNVLSKVSTYLAAIEKRDWELWLIVAVTGTVVGAGLLALAFPVAFLTQKSIRMEVEAPRELFFGLVALLILFNTYVISRRVKSLRTRSAIISTTIQSELVRLQSFTDPLTEVYNRRSLDDMATKYMSRAKRLKKPLTFMLIDADRFKAVNSRFGHLVGDFVIAEIATLLRSAARGTDAVIRYGGDEFLVILADSGLQGSNIVGSRITKSVEDWNAEGHLEGFDLSLSIGLAEWSEGKTLDQVLDEADRAMYSTKKATSGLIPDTSRGPETGHGTTMPK
jgi:diguanylate cyclase (GGDEF)-like protein